MDPVGVRRLSMLLTVQIVELGRCSQLAPTVANPKSPLSRGGCLGQECGLGSTEVKA